MLITNPVSLVVSVLLVFTSMSVTNADTIIDLSHPVGSNTLYWPGVPKFQRGVVRKFNFSKTIDGKNVWFQVGHYYTGEHGGTHIDVPKHFFFKGGLDLNNFPLKDTIAEGVMIDCRKEAAKDKNYRVPLSKVQEWEKEHGRIPNEAAVLFYFGYAQKFNNPAEFWGTQQIANAKQFQYPSPKLEATRWLVKSRNVKMVGVDTASPDSPQDHKFPNHIELLSRNKAILEMVNIPTNFPARGFRIHATPIKVEQGTGIQTRVYAMLIDDKKKITKAASISAGNDIGVSYSEVCMLVVCVVGVFTRNSSM